MKLTIQLTPSYFGLSRYTVLPRWFQHIRFICGLPDLGKSRYLYKQYKRDHAHDLCLSFARNRPKLDGLTYTFDKIEPRGYPDINAFQIPYQKRHTDLVFLKYYRLKYPNIKHILIDEVQYCPVKYLLWLVRKLHSLYPKKGIITAGTLVDFAYRPFRTGMLLYKFASHKNINPKCHFCNRPALYELFVYHHKLMNDSVVQNLKDHALKKRIENGSHRYCVCRKHFFSPPLNKLSEL